MSFQGLFSLQNVSDLLQKLEFDFGRLQRSPVDTYAAFDFFVTAEHMLDWQHPGDAHKKRRTQERRKEVLLQICSQIASGAKHFKAESPQHQSVKSSREENGGFDRNAFQNNVFDVGRLVIELEGDAAAVLGSPVAVPALAAKILNLWRNRLAP